MGKQCIIGSEAEKEFSKLNERSEDVSENKGPPWKNSLQSQNVYEKKALSRLIRECC
jgi:hypothetical protein